MRLILGILGNLHHWANLHHCHQRPSPPGVLVFSNAGNARNPCKIKIVNFSIPLAFVSASLLEENWLRWQIVSIRWQNTNYQITLLVLKRGAISITLRTQRTSSACTITNSRGSHLLTIKWSNQILVILNHIIPITDITLWYGRLVEGNMKEHKSGFESHIAPRL